MQVRNFSSNKILYIPTQHLPQPARNKSKQTSLLRKICKLTDVTCRQQTEGVLKDVEERGASKSQKSRTSFLKFVPVIYYMGQYNSSSMFSQNRNCSHRKLLQKQGLTAFASLEIYIARMTVTGMTPFLHLVQMIYYIDKHYLSSFKFCHNVLQ